MAYNFSPIYVTRFWGYNVQKVLPAVYSDELSYYELLAKLEWKINELVSTTDNLNDWQVAQDDVIDAIKEAVDAFIAGGYKDDFEAFLIDWFDKNFVSFLSERLKMVFFGLTRDGYFCAYVPDSWSDIMFDTGMNYADKRTYGRLILRYNVDDARGVIDNTNS